MGCQSHRHLSDGGHLFFLICIVKLVDVETYGCKDRHFRMGIVVTTLLKFVSQVVKSSRIIMLKCIYKGCS